MATLGLSATRKKYIRPISIENLMFIIIIVIIIIAVFADRSGRAVYAGIAVSRLQ